MSSNYWLDGKYHGKQHDGMVSAESLPMHNAEAVALYDVYKRYTQRWNAITEENIKRDFKKPLIPDEEQICGLFVNRDYGTLFSLSGKSRPFLLVVLLNSRMFRYKGNNWRQRIVPFTSITSSEVHYGEGCSIETLREWLALEHEQMKEDA